MGRYQISMYLMGKVFFKLYYHWAKDVRNTFYMFLHLKIKHITHQKGSDIKSQFLKVFSIIKVIENIHHHKHKQPSLIEDKAAYKKIKHKIYHKLKQKCSSTSSNITNTKSDYALENILKMLEDDQNLQENASMRHSEADRTPTKIYNYQIEN